MEGYGPMMRTKLAAVVIGRNEGERLEPSLRSVAQAGVPLVYVDSGSTDGSVSIARRLKRAVHELDPVRPFSAARARNEGVDEIIGRWPDTDFVLFLDGDCTLIPEFTERAVATFTEHPECAVVTGHLSERSPEISPYNRLCAIEWRGPAGRMENMNGLGGIMVVRVSAFKAVGGFNENAIAGEEPDLGVRLVLAGYSLIKIDQPMATHDAQILTFGQWWTRAVRGGHAVAHRFALHGRTRLHDGRRELLSALAWGFALPAAVLLLLWPTRGASLLLLAAYGLIYWRAYRHYARAGVDGADARLVAKFIVYSKFAHVFGIIRYCVNRARGHFHIIEYK